MRLGLGKLGLAPAEFWAMSWVEFQMAGEGLKEFHSGTGGSVKPPTKAEAQGIIQRAEAMRRERGQD